MKLLLAEDDRDMARGLYALLTRSNYSVDLVDNGLDAADYLINGDYDAAVLDIMMPGQMIILQSPLMQENCLQESGHFFAGLRISVRILLLMEIFLWTGISIAFPVKRNP